MVACWMWDCQVSSLFKYWQYTPWAVPCAPTCSTCGPWRWAGRASVPWSSAPAHRCSMGVTTEWPAYTTHHPSPTRKTAVTTPARATERTEGLTLSQWGVQNYYLPKVHTHGSQQCEACFNLILKMYLFIFKLKNCSWFLFTLKPWENIISCVTVMK